MSRARLNESWVSGFTADTPVLMANGKTKPISKVQEGEMIASFDPSTGQPVKSKVVNTWAEIFKDLLEVDVAGKTMVVASSQLFYTPDGDFKMASETDKICLQGNTSSSFTSRRYKGGMIKMYDLTVDKTHAFIANGVMVHNRRKRTPSPPDPVVTAGKVGQPVTITANGATVTVNPPPGYAASVAVSSNGGISTGYSAVPGSPAYFVEGQPGPYIAYPWYTRAAYDFMVSADSKTEAACSSLSSSPTRPSSSYRADRASELAAARADVLSAKASDPGYYGPYYYDRGTYRQAEYDRIAAEISELSSYQRNQNHMSGKNKRWISSQCANINTRIDALKIVLYNLRGPGEWCGLPAPVYPVPAPQPPVDSTKIYNTDPGYVYFEKFGNTSYQGCQPYKQSIPGTVENQACRTDPLLPGACIPSSGLWFKHYDTNNGKFYYDKNSSNCI